MASKTGLTKRMRTCMRSLGESFEYFDYTPVYFCLCAKTPAEKQKVRQAMWDFKQRGEVQDDGCGLFKYNPDWKHGRHSPVRKKIIKAMYLHPVFTVADIQGHTESEGRNYIDRIVARLIQGGHLAARGILRGQRILRVVDRERFRVEVVG
ncbi:unnamed protein product [marine sediment metagenome]|uniref:Uncharacterized protein n=1 Tax=marine sediment metagenome TaxID=412755 RepID=X0XG04_9ZZZZ